MARHCMARTEGTGDTMKRIVTHLSLLAATAILATGCVPVRHNLPPEQRLMEPGPGVGGPGPGVLGPPAMAPGMGGGVPMMGAGGMMGARRPEWVTRVTSAWSTTTAAVTAATREAVASPGYNPTSRPAAECSVR